MTTLTSKKLTLKGFNVHVNIINGTAAHLSSWEYMETPYSSGSNDASCKSSAVMFMSCLSSGFQC